MTDAPASPPAKVNETVPVAVFPLPVKAPEIVEPFWLQLSVALHAVVFTTGLQLLPPASSPEDPFSAAGVRSGHAASDVDDFVIAVIFAELERLHEPLAGDVEELQAITSAASMLATTLPNTVLFKGPPSLGQWRETLPSFGHGYHHRSPVQSTVELEWRERTMISQGMVEEKSCPASGRGSEPRAPFRAAPSVPPVDRPSAPATPVGLPPGPRSRGGSPIDVAPHRP